MKTIDAVIGLGNPGTAYEDTFHNAGFMVARRLAAPDARWRSWKRCAHIVWENPALVLPQTFMNRSGAAVQAFMAYIKSAPGRLLVICDDFSIPLGALRIRAQGSAGGHNGLASIKEALGTDAFPRLRVGIGPVDSGIDPARFVLRRLRGAARQRLDEAVDAAARAAHYALDHGIEQAMNAFNGKHQP